MSSSQTPFTPQVQEFIYQNMLGTDTGAENVPDLGIFDLDASQPAEPQANHVPNVSEIETQRREQAAYQRGLAAGRDEMRAQAESAAQQARVIVADNLQKFAEERQGYYRKVEGEVVDLVLAIARKVLHREAQVDRVVLGGVVRVALEKIAGGRPVALHVHPTAAKAWQEYLAGQTGWVITPDVVSDGSLSLDQIVLKTSHGNTELGVDAQLTEIDKGFADLVRQKQGKGRS